MRIIMIIASYVGVFLLICRQQEFVAGSNAFICSETSDNILMSSNDDLKQKIAALEEKVKQIQNLQGNGLTELSAAGGIPRDCGEIYDKGIHEDGVYSISPDGLCSFLVFCDMTNGGWTVIQRRADGTVNFYRPWDDYVSGFGDLNGEHWLGLEKIHRITKDGSNIYFDMEKHDGSKLDAHYKVFTVHAAVSGYKMNVDKFGYKGSLQELLSYHDNMKFSTYDRDNDQSSANCCKQYGDGGGWWFNSCYRLGMLNGVYDKREQGGLGYWDTAHRPLKNVTIKVRRMHGVCSIMKNAEP